MRALLIAATLAAAAFGTPVVAQDATPAPQIGKDDRAGIAEAERRGALLYAYDQAAWHGSDAFLAKATDDQKARIGGWVVTGTAKAPVFILLDRNAERPRALFVARFDGTRLASSRWVGPNDADAELNPEALALVAARNIAVAHFASNLPGRCSDRPFNSIVLPPADKRSATSVYLMTPQVDLKILPIGGHFRVDVAADGTPGDVRRFTGNCEDHDIPAPGPRGVLVVAAPSDTLPSEIHVFSSLTSGRPILLTTAGGSRRWRIEGGRITPIP